MKTLPTNYDFIFTGAGCAALSLLMRMISSGHAIGKKILLIDRAPRNTNDRTWCFWEKENGFFEDIVHRRWDNLDFFSNSWSGHLQCKPYQYKMIRGIDFYQYCFDKIKAVPGIEIMYGGITEITTNGNGTTIEIDNKPFHTGNARVFNSIYKPAIREKNKVSLLQHFKGWIIETDQSAFDLQTGTLMDFRVPQQHGTTFVYNLPLANNRALVEYTLFSGTQLSAHEYDNGLTNYIRDVLKIEDYTVLETESGCIPMTDNTFDFYKDGIYNIGTAGGQTKASSGYTFQFIQKHSQQIVDALLGDKPLQTIPPAAKRFQFYDTVLLRLLHNGTMTGEAVFSRLFSRNNAAAIFKFLDNESTLSQELKIISTLPALPFLKAALIH